VRREAAQASDRIEADAAASAAAEADAATSATTGIEPIEREEATR
jgi:hypothetical protein